MLHRRDGARSPDVTLDIQAKEFNLGFIKPENVVSRDLSPLDAFWQTPNGLLCAFYLNAADIFWYPSPDLCLDTILSRNSTDNSFDLMNCFLL